MSEEGGALFAESDSSVAPRRRRTNAAGTSELSLAGATRLEPAKD